METDVEQQKSPDVSTEQQEANRLIRLIRKLRWIGMDKEAERAGAALSSVPPGDSVLAAPHDTD
jgi:hypothetical protein